MTKQNGDFRNTVEEIVKSQRDPRDAKKASNDIFQVCPEITEQEFLGKVVTKAREKQKNNPVTAFFLFNFLSDLLVQGFQSEAQDKINMAQLYYEMASCFQDMKKHESAVRYSLIAFIFDPMNPHIPFLAAKNLIQLGILKHARETLELVLSMDERKELAKQVEECVKELTKQEKNV